MSDDQIVLFDLPSKAPCKAWSLNPWNKSPTDCSTQTRFLLNYKNLNYKTEWTEYPDIEPKFKDHVPPNTESFAYSIPTVKLADGTWIMESKKIATEIEKRYPSPSVHLDSPELAQLEQIMPKLMPTLSGVYIPLVVKRLLNEASHPHWYRTREAKFGMSLDQLAEEKGGQKAFSAAKPYLDEITALLKKNGSGPYFMGSEVSYSDFVWGGFLIFFQRIGADVYQDLIQTIGEEAHLHNKLLLALDKWSVRNDY